MLKRLTNKRLIIVLSLIIGALIIVLLWNIPDHAKSRKLVKAVQNENYEEVEKMLNDGVDPNIPTANVIEQLWMFACGTGRRWPLTEACKTKNLEMVRLLLDYGASPECFDPYENPLREIVSELDSNDYDMIVMLLESGANPFYNTAPANWDFSVNIFSRVASLAPSAHPDAAHEITRIMKYMINQTGADINIAHGEDGYQTLLMEASSAGNAVLVQYLLDIGADKTIVCHGQTAYDIAVERGYTEIAEMVKP